MRNRDFRALQVLCRVGLASVATLRLALNASKTQTYWTVRTLHDQGLVEPWGTPRRARGEESAGKGIRYAITEQGIVRLCEEEATHHTAGRLTSLAADLSDRIVGGDKHTRGAREAFLELEGLVESVRALVIG